MTLQQLQTYTVKVLKGWFTNKSVLDKFSESEDGKLLYNGKEIVPTVTDSDLDQSVDDTLTELGKDVSAPEILNIDIRNKSGNVSIDGTNITCTLGTEVENIVITMDETVYLADGANPIVTQVVKDITGTVISPPTVSEYYGSFIVEDNKLVLTPIPGNEIAGILVTTEFTVPRGIITDVLGNSKAYSFVLTVTNE